LPKGLMSAFSSIIRFVVIVSLTFVFIVLLWLMAYSQWPACAMCSHLALLALGLWLLFIEVVLLLGKNSHKP